MQHLFAGCINDLRSILAFGALNQWLGESRRLGMQGNRVSRKSTITSQAVAPLHPI